MAEHDLVGAILAAGLGTRLRPITSDKAKCCVTVAGTSILEHQLKAYASANIESVVIIVGYLHEQVRREATQIASEFDISVQFAKNPEYNDTNNMYSLYQAADELCGKEIILSNGDVVVEPSVIENLSTQKSDAIACQDGCYLDEAMKLKVDRMGSISHISKDIPESEAYGNSIDIYRFTSEFTEHLFEEIENRIKNKKQRSQWTELAINSLLKKPSINVKPFDIGNADWIEIDTIDDLITGDLIFNKVPITKKKQFSLI